MSAIWICILGIFVASRCWGADVSTEPTSIYYTEPNFRSSTPGFTPATEIYGGRVTRGLRRLEKTKSPYLLREDLIVDRDGELVIEPGVEIRFAPMIGLTILGILTAKGSREEPIVLTSAETFVGQAESRSIRLVDGSSPLEGRLQLLHQGEWRSVCTNSRKWTRADLEIACRALGWQGGRWWNWIDRQWPAKPRLLFEQPKCRGNEFSLQECQDWAQKQLGSGVCDYHPDLGISCSPYHDGAGQAIKHWRGVRFDGALYERLLTQENTFYVRRSRSLLRHVAIKNAGTGREFNVTSALHVLGVPPRIESLAIMNSAFTGINVTTPNAPVVIKNCTVQGNRGYGIFVNSSTGMVHVDNCEVIDNDADGFKYVHHDERLDNTVDRSNIFDLCTFPTTASQTFPITISMEQSAYSANAKSCPQLIFTRPGHRLTLHFLQMKAKKNDTATVEVYDGLSASDKLLAKIKVRNGTLPQSVTTTRGNLYIKFKAQPYSQVVVFVRLISGYSKTMDFNVTGSNIANNNGRGIVAERLRSGMYIHDTSVSNNNHVAGVHVLGGAMDVNITESRISFNQGDGVNITVTGGNRNVSRTSISSNQGFGMAVWLNDSASTEYIRANQTTVVEYSEIFRNRDIGIFVGNSTGDSYVNITGNWFNSSMETAVQVESSWRPKGASLLRLQIGYNRFISNSKLGIKLQPALNMEGVIEYNLFQDHTYGGILIRNSLDEEFNVLPVNIVIQYNQFYENRGFYVVSIGLSPYSDVQYLLFTKNFLRNNRVREPYDNDFQMSRLVPRSRVAAVLVVSSGNVHVFRNILDNHESRYEIGSHLEDQSKIINCTFNWLGFSEEMKIFERLFYRKDRYNLAKIEYIPYLLHNSNPGANTIISYQTFVPQFQSPETNVVGGEVDGLEILKPGNYKVERDINVRPGGKLILQSGVKLYFPPAVGMMVAGHLDARGKSPNEILLTLREEIMMEPSNETMEENMAMVNAIEAVPVRLRGGKTDNEGRLQVLIGEKWGTVCNYGWTIRDAAVVCHQLGLTLDPDNWFMERSHIPEAGTNEDIILSNVQCTEEDFDITKCRAESQNEFENSCTHDNDVGVRCSEAAWAGLRLGPSAQRSDLQYVTIEKAGLLDYSTNSFKPALQIDFCRHLLEGVRVVKNLQDGLGVLYSDIYSADATNAARNCEFSENLGSGISFKQLGLRISNSKIDNNKVAGIRHNPALSAVQQREFAGWFERSPDVTDDSSYDPIIIPRDNADREIELADKETKYLVTKKVFDRDIEQSILIKCSPGFVIGIQLLNPIHNRSTEQIILYNSQSQGQVWVVKRDLTVFPMASSSFTIKFDYHSGKNALGGTVMVLTSLPAPVQDIKNKIVSGPIPTLEIINTKIRRNTRGILASYYNRYLTEVGDHYLRKANESIQLYGCEISQNIEEAVYVHSPFWNVYNSNLSEITIHVNKSLIVDNGKGISQFSWDMRQSNNLFHWVLQDSTIERNRAGGFEVSLPYVWQYNENFTHSLYFDNNTWRNNVQFGFVIDGHYAAVNVTRNRFEGNQCETGLISIRGMEKKMKIKSNRIERNNGTYMVEFKIDSQSEIIGEIEAKFVVNEIRRNTGGFMSRGFHQLYHAPTYVVGFHGIQKVRVNRNLFSENTLDYELLAGIKTARINNEVDVTENWWDTTIDAKIRQKIFDFNDWNDHAVAKFRPYLTSDSFEASISASWAVNDKFDPENLGGCVVESATLAARSEPYIIKSDITIMPEARLHIEPGVVMEFAPNVGILVLGTLDAVGIAGNEIVMRPLSAGNRDIPKSSSRLRSMNYPGFETIRLCKEGNCSSSVNEGFVEFFNRTTLQWIPLCDSRFTERNAQVACRQLGYDPLNIYVSRDRRYEFILGSLSRIWSWPEPLQCTGNEDRLEHCQVRLNGQLYGQRHDCSWDGNFVFIHCAERNLDASYEYWGGIRIANSEFENHLYEYHMHDINTHERVPRVESHLKFLNITGAGMLHNERSAAIQSVMKSPKIRRVNIDRCAYHGINVVSPINTIQLLFNQIDNVLGNGVNILPLTGEGREAEESSFTPLKDLSIPYHLFSMVDICDTAKEVTVEERVLLYYKYDNNPVNCVKIFRSAYRAKPFGFRLLQFNLFNSTGKLGRADSIKLYDGDIYNVTSRKIEELQVDSHLEKKLFKTHEPSLSVRFFANGASSSHGFIAEIVTLPISAIGFNRDARHNISYSSMTKCREGALTYANAGEVNAVITLEKNRFTNNCEKLYGNFTTCKSSIWLDLQNTQSLYFRNNLVQNNQGGLSVAADSRGTATALKASLDNNLFTQNFNKPTLHFEGRQSSPYQEVTLYRNFFTLNNASYDSNIILNQVVSNMTLNYLQANTGKHLLEIFGFERVRLPIFQRTMHNGFYKNYATDREGRSTIVAGTPGQQYIDNVFFNPDNDYEMLTINRSLVIVERQYNELEMWSHIDARKNWWGYNETSAVSGRIRDREDSPELLQVDYQPFYMNNQSVLNGKCPPSWSLVGDTCYIYVGAPMDFFSAREFCKIANASMPFIMGEYLALWKFLRQQQQNFDYSERVWVQQLEKLNQCTAFTYQTIEIDNCQEPNTFICEIDPRISINPFSWKNDAAAVGLFGAIGVVIILLTAVIALWVSKSKKRKVERLERRNSIRQSLHSLRSIGSTSGFTELAYRRRPIATKQSNDTLNSRSLDYKKMSLNGGSLDSMDKSQLNSSMEEDNHSYDVYEAHNPRYSPSSGSELKGVAHKFQLTQNDNPMFDLAYRNEGFRNHSTFTSRNNSTWTSAANSEGIPDEQPAMSVMDVHNAYNNTSTLPLNTSIADSIIELKRDIESTPMYNGADYHPYAEGQHTPASEPLPAYFSPTLPRPYNYEDRPKSEALLETNFDGEERPLRSKSEVLLETNFDNLSTEPTELTQLSAAARSKSQPLETAM